MHIWLVPIPARGLFSRSFDAGQKIADRLEYYFWRSIAIADPQSPHSARQPISLQQSSLGCPEHALVHVFSHPRAIPSISIVLKMSQTVKIADLQGI
jgi:hypothetical protein